VSGKYEAAGPEGEFEPGSRGRVLRNLFGITRVRDMNAAESQALELAQVAAVGHYGPDHRLTADDIRALHRLWLGPIYSWAGAYRSVNIGKGGFQFAHAPLIARLMAELERGRCANIRLVMRPMMLKWPVLWLKSTLNSSWCTRFGTAMVVSRVWWPCLWLCRRACPL
jgi:hypothetical protein